jgi:hypothetical protein
MGGIYGLSSTRDRRIRYIGQTTDFDKRENDHRHYEAQPQLAGWIQNERRHGFDLVFDRLEHCGEDQLLWRENQWLYRVRPPLNVRKNWWGIAASWDEQITWMELFSDNDLRRVWEIANRPLGFVENWRGHVGVRYYPHSETWQVHVQTPGSYRNHYWLMETGGLVCRLTTGTGGAHLAGSISSAIIIS